MKRLVILIATTALLAAALAQPAPAFVDRDCSDFSSWRAAQRYYHRHGGPEHPRTRKGGRNISGDHQSDRPRAEEMRFVHPSRLDADHDGIACEDLR